MESYFFLYDHFIGNVNCMHVVVFNLEDPRELQVQQVKFWLTFLRSRIPPVEPLGKGHRIVFVFPKFAIECELRQRISFLAQLG